MKYALRYSRKARMDLARLNLPIAKRIVEKLDSYASAPEPMHYAKPLVGCHGRYRFRIGTYRAIFKMAKPDIVIILEILRIGHRKDIYNLPLFG